eukprot:14310698-Heterocapsa_arctica.AAC.1
MKAPQQHTVLLAALTGHNKFYDFYQLDEKGKPLPRANPWLHQWRMADTVDFFIIYASKSSETAAV